MNFEWEMAQVADSFMASKEYHDTMVAFDQESFNMGYGTRFKDYHHLLAVRLPKANLSFLDEDEGDEEIVKKLIFSSSMAVEK